jgi:hypothetical protein
VSTGGFSCGQLPDTIPFHYGTAKPRNLAAPARFCKDFLFPASRHRNVTTFAITEPGWRWRSLWRNGYKPVEHDAFGTNSMRPGDKQGLEIFIKLIKFLLIPDPRIPIWSHNCKFSALQN